MRLAFTLLLALIGDDSAGRFKVVGGCLASATGWKGPSLPAIGGVGSNLCPLGTLTSWGPPLSKLAGLTLFLAPPGSGAMLIFEK